MQIGRKSIITTLKVNELTIMIQANKNYGIIDMEPRIDDVLSSFQGRQVNDPTTMDYLENALITALTPEEQ
jgi:allophanate hydrolase subunit 1